jgi:hypothetical protein
MGRPIADVPPDDLRAGKTRVRHTGSWSAGLFVGWARPGWVLVVPDGENATFEWMADLVQVIE